MLTQSEKILLHSLKRIVIRGKRGRGVPVLFDTDTVQSIEFLMGYRKNFDLNDNIYLFGLPGTSNPIAGAPVMRKHARKALGDANKASLLTSTRLRKHLATMVQILKMERSDLEQLATFMGHTEATHSQFYRLPDDIYQTAKVSKLLLMAKSGSIEQYKGKSLTEIQLDGNLIDDVDVSDIEDEVSMENDDIRNVENVSDKNEALAEKENSNILKNKKQKRKLVPWTAEQKKLAESFFKMHIVKKKPPKKEEVISFIGRYPNVFANKTWAVIKVYVQNKYSKKGT